MKELAEVRSHGIRGGSVIEVLGEVDLSNAHAVFERAAALAQSGATLVVLDLGGTDYLDSSGIAMVFRLAERLRVGRQDLRVVAPTGGVVRAVLDIAAVDQAVPVYSTVAEAQAAGAR